MKRIVILAIIIFIIITSGCTSDNSFESNKSNYSEHQEIVHQDKSNITNDMKNVEDMSDDFLFDVKKLIGLSKNEVITMLGDPLSTETGNWQLTENREHTGETTTYELLVYNNMDVMIIFDTAARVTFYPEKGRFKLTDPEPILESIGLEYDWFYLEEPRKIIWPQHYQVAQVTASSDNIDEVDITMINVVLEERFW